MEPWQPPNLPSLNNAFLAACRENDLTSLAKLNADLSRVVNELERPSYPVLDDNTKLELLLFSYNVDIASTLATKAQIVIEDLSNQFSQQLRLVAGTPHATQALLAPSSQDFLAVDNSAVLKEWALLHMFNLFPSKDELEELASRTSMSSNQINHWFRNARTRSGWSKVHVHPNVKKDQEQLKALLKEYDALKSHENFSLFLARDELLQLLDKACGYFSTNKKSNSSKLDAIRPWVKDVLSNAFATLKDKTAGALDSSRHKLSSLPSRKRARTNKFTPSSSPLSHTSTPIAGPSNTPSLLLKSSRSSLSQLSTTGSISNPSSIATMNFSPFLGSVSDESLYSGDTSPGLASTSSSHLLQASPVFCSLPRACTPANPIPSLGFVFKTPQVPPNHPSALYPTTAPITSDHSTNSNQFEDANEV